MKVTKRVKKEEKNKLEMGNKKAKRGKFQTKWLGRAY